MADTVISSKASTEVFTGYRHSETQDGEAWTYDADRPYWTSFVYGSGVQKTPNFKSRKGAQRKYYGPAYHKKWWTENPGTRLQVDKFHQSAYTYVSGGVFPAPESWSYVTQEHQLSGLFPTISEPATLELVDEVDRLATARLLDQLRGEGANLANALGERKQTEKSIVTLMHRLANAAFSLKRRDLKGAFRYLFGDGRKPKPLKSKDIANMWLELQYGWKPLCSDIFALVERLHEREAAYIYTFRASSKKEYIGRATQSWGTDPIGKRVGTVSSTAISKYVVQAKPDGILRAPASLGFTNPLVVAWEVTPWSFVVDWILPVGAYLDQLTADHGWTFINGGGSSLLFEDKSFIWDYQTETSKNYVWPYLDRVDTTKTIDTGFGKSEMVDFRRGPLPGFPQARLPKVKNPFSIGHFENALALMWQVFDKPGVSPRK